MDTSPERAENQPLVPPQRGKKQSRLILTCLAVLILILVGGSLSWLLLSGTHSPARATRSNVPAIATSSPTWTPTEVTPPAAATFYDTFVNNKHGWSLSGTGGDLRILTNSRLILASMNPDTTLIESVPASTTLDDYVVSVDFTLNLGDTHDSVGLYVRGDSHLDHDYRIDITGNKTVDVAKEWLDSTQTPQSTMLVSPRPTHLLNPPGKSNTLTVFLIDQTITVLVNNVALTTFSDSAYTSGQVALFVHHAQSPRGAIYSFSRVEIDHLASPFATPAPTFKLNPRGGSQNQAGRRFADH
ncbi:MAG: hypothetical protein ACRDHW_07935 [Ktedonobacteraceae bacterium]